MLSRHGMNPPEGSVNFAKAKKMILGSKENDLTSSQDEGFWETFEKMFSSVYGGYGYGGRYRLRN